MNRKGALIRLLNDCKKGGHRNSPATHIGADVGMELSVAERNRKDFEQGFFDLGNALSLGYHNGHFVVDAPSEYSRRDSNTADGEAFGKSDYYVEPFDTVSNQKENQRDSVRQHVPIQDKDSDDFTIQDENHTVAERKFSASKNTTPPTRDALRRAEPSIVQNPSEARQEVPSPGEGEDGDFEQDIREILAGKKRYDAAQKNVVPTAGSRRSEAHNIKSDESGDTEMLKGEFTKNEHAIFDRIAQSMKFATAYDLGSIALDNRFDAFEKEHDRQEKKKTEPENGYTSPRSEEVNVALTNKQAVNVGTAEFLRDLDKISGAQNLSLVFSNDIPLSPANGGRSIGDEALEIGDIILSTTVDASISGVIRSVTRSAISHASVYIGNGSVIEAIESGVIERSLETAMLDDTVAVAFRHLHITPDKSQTIQNFLVRHRQQGTRFDRFAVVRNLPIQMIASFCAMISPNLRERCRNFAGRIFLGTDTNNEFYCSELVFAAYEAAGLRLANTQPHWTSAEDLVQLNFNGTLRYVGHLKTT